jgi:hypothetical protein
MKMEDITMMGTVGWMNQLFCPGMVQDSQERRRADTPDDAPDDPAMFMPTPQPVWPRVWPGL